MAGFAPHGKCTVSWQGNLLTVSYEGVFNREGAEVLGQALEAPLAERAGRPWVMLNDARLWEGGTPEAFACWAAYFDRWADQGLVALAAVYSRGLQQMLTQTLRSHVSGRVPRHFSDTPEACLAWLAEHGLGPD